MCFQKIFRFDLKPPDRYRVVLGAALPLSPLSLVNAYTAFRLCIELITHTSRDTIQCGRVTILVGLSFLALPTTGSFPSGVCVVHAGGERSPDCWRKNGELSFTSRNAQVEEPVPFWFECSLHLILLPKGDFDRNSPWGPIVWRSFFFLY